MTPVVVRKWSNLAEIDNSISSGGALVADEILASEISNVDQVSQSVLISGTRQMTTSTQSMQIECKVMVDQEDIPGMEKQE